MFSDANIKHSADAIILRGFSIEDIDEATLRQYRRLYDSCHENHPWSQLDDIQFLTKIGAYGINKVTEESGFTVAGMLMFGKTESITDQECLPYFYVDYRERLSDFADERWSHRI